MGKIDPLLGLWKIYELPKLNKLKNMTLKTLIKQIKSGKITDKQLITDIINNENVKGEGLSYSEYIDIPGDGLQERVNYILNKCNFKDKKQKQQKQMTKSKSSSKSKKVSKVKIETTPSGSYRVRKSSQGLVINRTFKKKKDAVTFRDAFYA